MRVRHFHGFAVPVVLLVGAVILVSVVTATSVTALGARVGTANERVAYQALLAAESGINTFMARASIAQRYSGALTEAGLGTWLTENGLVTRDLGSQRQVTLSVVPGSVTGNTFTLSSSGTVGAGAGAKIVLQDVELSVFNGTIGAHAPAALTSIPTITMNANQAFVVGKGGSESSWLFDIGRTAAASSGNTVTVTAAVASQVVVNDYLRINNSTYKVTEKNGTVLTLAPVSPTTTVSIANNHTVFLAPYANTQPISQVVNGSSEIPVTDSAIYRVGDQITMGTSVGNVTAVANKLLTVSWTTNPPTQGIPLPEGTPIRKAVYAGVSQSATAPGRVNNFIDDENGRGKWTSMDLPSPHATDGNHLFESIFGISESAMRQLAQSQNAIYSSLPNGGNVNGLVWLEGHNQNTNHRFCGSGIVIVNGNFSTHNGDNCTFSGVVYVMGDYNEQGNRQLRGAVVVEGVLQCSGQTCTTDINGNGEKIVYDPLALRRETSRMPPIEIYNGFELIAGTWRQR